MKFFEDVQKYATSIEAQLIRDRRQFHSHPEVGWTEFQTAATVAARLKALGYQVDCGKDVINPNARMGVPEDEILEDAYQRALANGFDMNALAPFKGGYTGVVGKMRFGEGITVALRFDMDAIHLEESRDSSHRPVKEGFSSRYEGIMHGCGHDAHTAIGLAVAEILAGLKDHLKVGTVKLIFQPSEEGVRGAKSMVAAGVLSDVDYALACHMMANEAYGSMVCGVDGYMATSKLDVMFNGEPAHAGAAPNEGKHAILAACAAVMNLQAIPRHAAGASRINVGTIHGGTDRNVIPEKVMIKLETRGETTEINQYVRDYAIKVIEGAGTMHNVHTEVKLMGEALGGKSDQALVELIYGSATSLGIFEKIELRNSHAAGSEDFTYMMSAVQNQGGEAVYFMIGAAPEETKGVGHHTRCFDIDERAMISGVQVFIATITKLLKINIVNS